MDLRDRICGCLLGGAIGDAMGIPFEGQRGPLRFFEHAPWTVSDDTQLTLATCESITELGFASPEHIASRFASWFRSGRITGVGASTLKALRDLDIGAHWALAGARGERTAGNGAAMRAAPLAFVLDPRDPQQRQTLRDICRITHHHDEAYIAALAVVVAIRAVCFGEQSPPKNLLQTTADALPDSRVRDRLFELAALPAETALAEVAMRFGCSGYAVESVSLALFAANSAQEVELPVLLQNVIECGGDTDTIASITGQIVGAAIGASGISQDLLEALPSDPDVLGIANAFANRVATLTTS